MASILHLVDLDMVQNSILNAAFQPLAVAPSTPVLAQTYFDTTIKSLRIWDGSQWINMGPENFLASSTYSDVTKILTLTLTDGSNVTVDLSNLEELFVLGVVDTQSIDLTLTGNGLGATPWSVTGDVKVSVTAGNILTSTANGLYVPTPTTPTTSYAATVTLSSPLGWVTVNHALNTTDVIVQVYRVSSNALVTVATEVVDANNIRVSANGASASYRVKVQK